MESEYTVQNGYGTEKSIVLISALYQDKKLLNIKTKELTIDALNTESDSITMEIPEESGDCYIKLLVWEDMQTLKPLGDWKNINDLDSYSREKFLYIDAGSQEEINIYMNAVTTKGLSNETIHTISFDTSKLALVDLCSMTYEKELSEGIINNMGITVESVDTTEGVVRYKFDLPEGRNTGIINVLKLKALEQIQDELLTYTIN